MDIDLIAAENQLSREQYLSRLYWRCRRGMLELDSLLDGFFHCCVAQLPEQELKDFERLLATSDTILLEYLMGRAVPTEPGLAHVVNKIRHSALS